MITESREAPEAVLAPHDTESDPPDAPEVSVRTTATLLLYFERQYGTERLEALLRREALPLSTDYLRDPANFISLRFLERLAALLSRESGDPSFMRNAGLFLASPDGLGTVFYILRAFGTPRVCYEKTLEISKAYNLVGDFHVDRLEGTELEFRYRSRKPEATRDICELRMGQFASFPTIWGLPPAEVREVECQVHGAEACRYQARWTNPASRRPLVVGTAVGAGLGVGVGLLGLAPLAFSILVLGACGGLWGAWLGARREIATRDASISSHHRALTSTLTELEARYQDVFRAKGELEERVASRTHELSLRTDELAEANEKLAKTLERMQEVDRAKTEFFANVNHELRTPLTLMLLSVEGLARRSDLAPEVRHYVEALDRSGARLLRLINQLLELSRVEAGKARLRYGSVELFDLLNTIAVPFKVAGENRRVKVTVEGGPQEPVIIDSERIETVFQNLLSNALKFTADGGEVRARLRTEEGAVVVEIIDSGAGIAPDDLSRIFDRFAQADNGGLRRLGGSGIGLALVKELVTLHGGTISVESAVGRGSTFAVRLPRGSDHVREELRERRSLVRAMQTERRGSFAAAGGVGAPRLDPVALLEPMPTEVAPDAPLVLVAEDEADLREFLEGILGTQYRVIAAANGKEALDLARDRRPALIVSDVMMPLMSGTQVVRMLRSDAATSDIPVLLLTANGGAEQAARGLEDGASDYLSKPFSPRELLARVEAQLRLRDASARAAENARLSTLGLVSSGFAHEIRNPLNGLLHLLGPLRELLADAPPEARELLELAQECGTRIHGISEQLLEVARQGGEAERFDLVEALHGTIKVLEWSRPVKVRIEAAFSGPLELEGDRGALNQVWMNLLDNAVRAVGPAGTVRVEAEVRDGRAFVTITDSGAGMTPEVLARVFEPFFSTRGPGEGTGLGLTLSRRIVLEHGGSLKLTSEHGEGTRAAVELPVVVPRIIDAARTAA